MSMTPAQLRALKGGVPTPPRTAVRPGFGSMTPSASSPARQPERAQSTAPTPRPGPAPAPAPPPGREPERYWWQPDWNDDAYNAQLAALNRALADYETGLGLKGQRYGTDYLQGVRELGFRTGEGFSPTVDIMSLDIPATGGPSEMGRTAVQRAMGMGGPQARGVEMSPIERLQQGGGQWDYEGEFNPFSAAARGTRTARDEFAGRGTLRSSDFTQSYADFQDRLLNQLTSMEQGRTRFFEDAAMDLAQQRSRTEEQRQAARVNAMARAASQGEYRTR